MRLLELFAGLGGAGLGLGADATTVLAVDLDPVALRVAAAHGAPTRLANLTARRLDFLPEADLWWLSPPCQPFTVRGARRDLDDPRCRPLVRLLDAIDERRPRWIAIENVPGFLGSRACDLVQTRLAAVGYHVTSTTLCPTALGWPNPRRRVYLLAGPSHTPAPLPQPPPTSPPLSNFLDAEPDPDLVLPEALTTRYRHALPVVRPADTASHCFTSAYGRSPVHCGSVLDDPALGLRLFSPHEVARLLGFQPSFAFPADLSRETAWGLIGNSLNLLAVRHVLTPCLRDLAG